MDISLFNNMHCISFVNNGLFLYNLISLYFYIVKCYYIHITYTLQDTERL